MYGSVQAAFRHGITAPFRRPQRDPPPPGLEQPHHHLQAIEDHDDLAGGDAPQHGQRQQANDGRLHRNQVHQRRPNRPREEPAKRVETLRTAEPLYSEDETDAERREAEQNLSAESDSENQQETKEEPTAAGAGSVAANTAQSETKPTESDSSQPKTKPLKVNKKPSKDNNDELSRDSAASQPAGRQPSQTNVQVSSF